MAIVVAFGDSITYGFGDKEGGWVERLRKEVDKRNLNLEDDYWYSIYPMGIEGANTKTLCERFENEVKARLWPRTEMIILVNIGFNDALFYKDQNKLWVPVEETKINIQKVINIANKYSSKGVFIGPSLVDETKSKPVYWDSNLFYSNQDIKEYNEAIKTVCERYNTKFIDIATIFENHNYKTLLIDGVHPNTKGHELIFKIVKDYLVKNKIVEF